MKPPQDSSDSGVWRRNLAQWSRALFEGIDDAVFVHDLRGRIVDANPAACRRLGYSREELLKLYTSAVEGPDFARTFEQRLERQMVEGQLRCEGTHRTKDGRTILVDINSSAIDYNGRPCILLVMRDITTQKKAELTLVKQKELLRSILENMGDGVVVVGAPDADGNSNLLICTPIAQRLFGLRTRVSPQAGDGLVWPPEAKMFLADQVTPFPPRQYPWIRVLQGKHITDVEMFVRPNDADHGHWLSITARPLLSHGSPVGSRDQAQRGPDTKEANDRVRGGVLVCRDITEQKQAERRQEIQSALARVLTSAKPTDSLGQLILKAVCDGLNWDIAILWVVDPMVGSFCEDLSDLKRPTDPRSVSEESPHSAVLSRQDRPEEARLKPSTMFSRPELVVPNLIRFVSQTTYARGEGLVGKVWENAAPVWRCGIAEESAFSYFVGDIKETGLQMVFLFPLWSSGSITGVVQAFSRNNETPKDELLRLVGSLSSQIGQLLERQRVENALRESQTFYHSLVESLPQNLLRKDRNGRLTFCNQRYCNLLGKTLDELKGKTDFDLFPERLAAKYHADDLQVMKTGQPLEVVEEHEPGDGTTMFVQVIKTPIQDEKGRIIGIQGLFWDVTERIRAQRALADSERKYRQLTEATQDAIILTDSNAKITLFNPAAEHMFGYSEEEISGQPFEALFPETLANANRSVLDLLSHSNDSTTVDQSSALFPENPLAETDPETTEKGQQRTRLPPQGRRNPATSGKPVELYGLRKDGTKFPVEMVLTVLTDAEDESRVSESFRDGQPMLRAGVSRKPADPSGRASSDRSSQDLPDPRSDQNQSTPIQGSFRFLAALRDMTERNRLRSILIQNEKLASIGLLSAGVAHEINNPIAFVSSNIAVLQRDLKGVMEIFEHYQRHDDEFAKMAPETAEAIAELAEEIDLAYIQETLPRLLDRTRDGVDRVSRIVNSLRGLARTGGPERDSVALPELINQSLEIIRNRAKRSNIEIVCDYDPVPIVSCVPSQLNQVLLNLFVNAVQAMEQVSSERPNSLKIMVRRLNGEMLVQISDTGCGIAEAHLPKVFDPFFTTKEVGEGTGLGLSITHNIISAHGGRVEVDSAFGEGTTFRIYLPVDS